MSALSVCNGTLPSLYHSVLAISAPFNLPETSILTPLALCLNALWTVLFMARLNITLFSSCCATPSARIVASKSGFFTSFILICEGPLTIFSTAFFKFSISSPRFPIIMPGLAVWILTINVSAVLSSSILLIEEFLSFVPKWFLTLRSSIRFLEKSFPLAYQFAFCFLETPNLKPFGLTFCPIICLPLSKLFQYDMLVL